MNQNYFWALFVLFLQVNIYGQSSSITSTKLNTMETLAPEVRKFIEYGDYSLNYTKASPNISLPIYSFQTKTGLEIPVSLDYASSGIKVNELASNIGLGWLLNAYGVITVDTSLDYELFVSMKTKLMANDNMGVSNFDTANSDLYDYLDNLLAYPEQGKTPIFSYSFFGKNGKFVFDSSGKSFGMPFTDMQITLSGDKNTIIIVDTQGNTYYFSKQSYGITSDKHADEFSKSHIFFILSKIKLPNNELVEFTYNMENSGSGFLYNYQIKYDFDTDYNLDRLFVTNELGVFGSQYGCNRALWPEDRDVRIYGSSPNLNIKQIKYGDILVSFKYSSQDGLLIDESPYRKDVGTTSKALKKVEVLFKNQLVNYHLFNYTYFVSDDTVENKPEKYRLKLVSVTNSENQTHQFEYFEDVKLPSRDSFSLDRWGHFNGQNNNTLLPNLSFSLYHDPSKNISLPGSTRNNASLSQIRAYSLKKIIYPTKGFTEFIYSQPSGVVKSLKERTQIKAGVVSINYGDTDYMKSNTFSLSALGYDPQKGDRVYINYNNGCDNAFPTENPGLGQLVPGASNGSVGVHFPDGFYDSSSSWTGVQYGDISTRNYQQGPLVPLGDQVSINVIRDGSCLVSGSVSIHRTLYDTISEVRTLPFMMLQAYKSYSAANVLDKEVTYQYKKDITSPSTQVSYNTPIFYGESSKQIPHPSERTTATCRIIVRSSTALNEVKEPYYPYVHQSVSGVGRTYNEFTGGASNIQGEPVKNGYPEYNFDYNFILENDLDKGLLVKQEVYGLDNKLRSSLTNTYQMDTGFTSNSQNGIGYQSIGYSILLKGKFATNLNTMPGVIDQNYHIAYQLMPIQSAWIKKTAETFRTYFDNAYIDQTKTYTYEDIELPTQINTTYKNKSIVEKFTYPKSGDLLFTHNKKAEVVKYELFENSVKLQSIENVYANWGNNIIDIKEIRTSKGTAALQSVDKILHRDNRNGNVVEMEIAGVKETYIYGYGSNLLIATIRNASKETVASALGVSVSNLFTIDETKLVQLNNLRNNASLKDALVTTYEYKPLVGVTKITDPKGVFLTYEYDTTNRLQKIKDQAGNIIEEYQYNYRIN